MRVWNSCSIHSLAWCDRSINFIFTQTLASWKWPGCSVYLDGSMSFAQWRLCILKDGKTNEKVTIAFYSNIKLSNQLWTQWIEEKGQFIFSSGVWVSNSHNSFFRRNSHDARKGFSFLNVTEQCTVWIYKNALNIFCMKTSFSTD